MGKSGYAGYDKMKHKVLLNSIIEYCSKNDTQEWVNLMSETLRDYNQVRVN
jgi:hypothetical protein